MVGRSKKIASEQRHRVVEAYRGRGRRTNSLWLVYSVKTERDLILTSDRQLVHWVIFLEMNTNVCSFEIVQGERQNQYRNPSILVETFGGSEEIHIVGKAADSRKTADAVHGNIDCRDDDIREVKIFCDEDLKPSVPTAMRWLKALSFAAAVREQAHTPVALRLYQVIRELGAGTVGEIVEEMAEFEEPVVLGILVRMSVTRGVELDLTSSPFTYKTPWKILKLSDGK